MKRLRDMQPRGAIFTKLYKFQSLNRNNLSALLSKAHWAAKPGTFNDPFDTDLELLDVSDENRDKVSAMGIVSLSANPESSLLWSHYADQHQGFALGFQLWMDKIPDNLIEVEYVSELPEKASNNPLFDATKYKASEWAYENEYRLVYEKGGRLTEYSLKLTDVVFGLRMTEADRHLVARVAGKNVGYHWASRGEKEFEVKIKFSKFLSEGVHTWPPAK